jgi:predicted adenine nucleotide alpha hydrolase (AANH) superfamily ATPase
MLKNKVLVHCCCAICAGYPLEMLKEDFEPVAFFYNPNIYPFDEYNKRLDALKMLCEYHDVELVVSEYDNDFYEQEMKEYKTFNEGSQRCLKCFDLRLKKTCLEALKREIMYFTTTLSISPHKNFQAIKQIGDNLAKEYQLGFLDYNFKKKDGFLKTLNIAKNLNLYRQNYCGCKNSMH